MTLRLNVTGFKVLFMLSFVLLNTVLMSVMAPDPTVLTKVSLSCRCVNAPIALIYFDRKTMTKEV